MNTLDLTGATILPRALSDFELLPGSIKEDYEDFAVEEIPLYEPCGEGDHVYFMIEKRGLSTMNAVQDIARALNLRQMAIGYAGLKDARAITRQWLSIEHIDPAVIEALEIPRIRVVQLSRHRNKLRLGHLAGNHFTIRVRRTDGARLADVQDALLRLTRDGVPNYFGEQRFGGRGDAWEVGRAILRRDADEAIDVLLGRPNSRDHGDILRARQLYEGGDFRAAGRRWPGMFRTERRLLRTLANTRGNRKRAFAAIDKVMRRFYVSAYQSHLFNRFVAERVRLGLSRLLRGDLAMLHPTEKVFRVEDVAAEQVRADAFQISATGPLFGYRMTEASDDAGEIEQRILGLDALSREDFREGPLRVKGARRSIRFQPTDASARLGADDRGVYFEIAFVLPRGCYATTLLRELFHEGPIAPDESDMDMGSDQAETDHVS